MEAKYIIPKVINWRKEDYDGYNDYFVDKPKNMQEYEMDV